MTNSQRKARKATKQIEARRIQQQQQRIINIRRDKEQQAAKAIPHNESTKGSMVVTKANKAAIARVAKGDFRHHNVSVGGGIGEGKADMSTKSAPYKYEVEISQAKKDHYGF